MSQKSVSIDDLNSIIFMGEMILKQQELKSRNPNNRKGAGLFKPTIAEKMVGKSSSTINKLELEQYKHFKEGNPDKALFTPCERTEADHRKGYSLEVINYLRDHFKTAPKFKLKKDAMVVAVQNFKGGVTKSSTTITLAHILGLQGFRVLVIDQDSQATTTSSFGYIPDLDDDLLGIPTNNTLVPYMYGTKGGEDYGVDVSTINYAIRKTQWHGVDLIPANMDLFYAELELVSEHLQGRLEFDIFQRLRTGIDTVKDKYDIVLIDAPPSLGATSINIINAADGVIVPCPPRIHDFSSTIQFLRMLVAVYEKRESDRPFLFMKLLVTMYDKRKTVTQKDLLEGLEEIVDSKYIFKSIIPASSFIENAFAEFQSPLEYKGTKNKEILSILNNFGDEVAELLFDLWPAEKVEEKEEVLI